MSHAIDDRHLTSRKLCQQVTMKNSAARMMPTQTAAGLLIWPSAALTYEPSGSSIDSGILVIFEKGIPCNSSSHSRRNALLDIWY
jgi:hypothetical protein